LSGEFFEKYDNVLDDKIIDIFTSFFKQTSPTSVCENKFCNIVDSDSGIDKVNIVSSRYKLRPTNSDSDKTILNMVLDYTHGYSYDRRLICDSFDGSLRTS